MCSLCSPRIATFHFGSTTSNGYYCSREKVFPTPPLILPEWPMGPSLVSLIMSTIEVVGLSQTSIDRHSTSVYWIPYIQHAISTSKTCSRGPTHRSLTDTIESYNFGGSSFSHHSPHPSQPTLLRFPLMAPSGLRLTSLT
jgi:hypothetical protein